MAFFAVLARLRSFFMLPVFPIGRLVTQRVQLRFAGVVRPPESDKDDSEERYCEDDRGFDIRDVMDGNRRRASVPDGLVLWKRVFQRPRKLLDCVVQQTVFLRIEIQRALRGLRRRVLRRVGGIRGSKVLRAVLLELGDDVPNAAGNAFHIDQRVFVDVLPTREVLKLRERHNLSFAADIYENLLHCAAPSTTASIDVSQPTTTERRASF